jgi:hypothetical protein
MASAHMIYTNMVNIPKVSVIGYLKGESGGVKSINASLNAFKTEDDVFLEFTNCIFCYYFKILYLQE